ncbi:MAG: caspase family protein [Putridiphycobacter sp.]|nr:caspase family protein [Putridiphycobacter sp.]
MLTFVKYLFFFYVLFQGVSSNAQVKPEIVIHKGHLYPITKIEYSFDDKFILSLDEGYSVIIWNTFLGKQVSSFNEVDGINTIQFFPNSNEIIYSTLKNQIKIWSIAESKLISTFSFGKPINDFCFVSSSQLLIASETLFTYDLRRGTVNKTVIQKEFIILKSDLVKREVFGISAENFEIYLLDFEGKSILPSIKLNGFLNKKTSNQINKNTIDFNFKSRLLFFPFYNSMYGYNLLTNEMVLKKFTDYFDETCTAIAYADKDNLVIYGTSNNTINIHNLDRLKVKTLRPHVSEVSQIKFSHGQKQFASASKDNSIIIWDVNSLKMLHRLRMSSAPLHSLAIDEKGTTLCTGNSIGEIKYIDLDHDGGQPSLANYWAHTNVVADIVMIDSTIFSVGYDNHVAISSLNKQVIEKMTFVKNKKAKQKKNSTKINQFIVKQANQLVYLKSENEILISGEKNGKPKQLKLALGNESYKLEQLNSNQNLPFEAPEEYKLSFRLSDVSAVISVERKSIYYLHKGEKQLIGEHDDDISAIGKLPGRNMFVSVGKDGVIKLWTYTLSPEFNAAFLVSIVPLDREKMLIYDQKGYYFSINNAINEVGFKIKEAYYLVEQFDLKYNRPDIILEKVGFADPSLVAAYHAAYKKRLKKMGFTEVMLESDFHLPEIEIEHFEEMPTLNDEGSIDLNLKLYDSKYKLDRINVWVNDVAIYGTGGISLRDKNVQDYQTKLTVDLAKGNNKVQVSVLNQAGAESYKETFEIECTTGKNEPNLYLITIGESEFQQADYNLTYAAKDANDIAALFSKSKAYKEVFTKTLVNQEVTKENVRALKSFLSQATINDEVMIFIAGHGVLDDNLDYYFATYDMDFINPGEKGLAYDDLEGLLDGIKPLKKTLMIDACHSGEIDKDEVELAEADIEEGDDIQFRVVGNTVSPKLGTQNTSELTKSLFTDLRKGTGATVISSAGGMEFAMEGDDWRNGLFTYCLIKGIKTKAADYNADGEIWLSEIKRYVSEQVTELSNGKQQPTSRIENQVVDFRVW